MTAYLAPSTLRTAVLAVLVSLQFTWVNLLNTKVPNPYLDEVFHIPQAQAYWAGRWSHWDDKITTPPGLYLWSYVFNIVRRLAKQDPEEMVSVSELRFSNAILIYVLVFTLVIWGSAADRRSVWEVALPKEFVVMSFPLLAFFSGLYYTDLFSAWTVVATCAAWEKGRMSTGFTKAMFQVMHVLLGLLSLASRQTNIFWVAILLGGLQAVDTVQAGTSAEALQDPEIGETKIEDVSRLVLQLLPKAFSRLPSLVVDLWPQLALLGSFAAFVVWNEGVVLGDKSNHIATIHLPQLLYIWPCIVFFSWPVLLPQLLSPRRFIQRLPRPWLSISVLSGMTAAVHYNTIVHPFTLADNRHYVFYVFRILTREEWIKYAAVPAYYLCGCLVVGALSGGKRQITGDDSTVRLSFLLVWFMSTALSLVTAPLVEPRYFIVPWLVWRMYVPELNSDWDFEALQAEQERKDGSQKVKDQQQSVQLVTSALTHYTLWIELGWYLLVNYGTCWMFLNRGFQWTQEPGKVQRFMW